ncbi:hypothetical protein [Dyella tabacisoli]|uniref:Phage late control D family protein n=1 Tax=Dyella tabacisoli TaxID=2282381 RepID=A0A369UR61_9GAMM|nr:hypothetical protein [Dyella tabacisoli]RDD82120.1 hypothetical protein DVJ77_08655 [Dyella tabacisoli]
MLKGVHLTLMIGPGIPIAVPESVLDALVSIEVVVNSGNEPSGFELVFTLSNNSPLQTLFLLAGGGAIPFTRVVIVVTVSGNSEVIMDGVMTDHQFSPGTADGQSTLTVKGTDLTGIMDIIDFSGIPYPAMPREARVALVVAKYAVLGLIPLVIPSILFDVPLPIQTIPRQQGKDLAYVRQLADEVGYIFCIEFGPKPGVSFAYWGPEIRVGQPQPALNLNMDAETNIEQINFRFDKNAKVMPIVVVQEPFSKIPIPIPIPDITPLNPPLGLIPPIPPKIELLKGNAKYSILQGIVIGLTKAAQTSDCVFGEGTLDVLRYGQPLKARRLVGVRGVGAAFDGLHYVKKVTHKIKRGEYKQSFSLARNGLISTFPNIPV